MDNKKFKLPTRLSYSGSMSIESAIEKRETRRKFNDAPIKLSQLSQLLWSAQGKRHSTGKFNAPSAAGQYPLDVYIVASKVTGVKSGLYRYDNSDHSLTHQICGDFREPLSDAAIGEQPWVQESPLILVITANIELMRSHFSDQPPMNMRGSRYVYIETGAAAQNVHLQVTALNLGMVLVGGFENSKIQSILKLPKELEATALLCIGNI